MPLEPNHPSASGPTAAGVEEHFFRHEFGRCVAALTQRFGSQHVASIEDAVQQALLEAWLHWRQNQTPRNPSAWIRVVAERRLIDQLRRERRQLSSGNEAWLEQLEASAAASPRATDWVMDTQLQDPMLAMMFACCHPDLSPADRIALTLKALGGFSIDEIARGLLLPKETVKKRLQRARERFAATTASIDLPPAQELPQRLHDVHQVLYVMFNEGYCSQSGDRWIRADVCEEAARLCHLLLSHPTCATPTTHALLALMLLHAARFSARIDDQGWILLLEHQDRRQWDRDLIQAGSWHLNRSAVGEEVTPYHLEAAIAWNHCQAPSFDETDWPAIQRLYNLLWLHWPSPLYRLNAAIAQSYVEGPAAALETLTSLVDHPQLENYHWLAATRAEMHQRLGDTQAAEHALREALVSCRSPVERRLLETRLGRTRGQDS